MSTAASHKLMPRLVVQGKGARAVRYQACGSDDPIFLHPRSALHRAAPDLVAFTSLQQTEKRTYMTGVTAVDAQWLPEVGCPLAQFRGPVDRPAPAYNAQRDQVLAWFEVAYGVHGWELPLHAGAAFSVTLCTR